jgi:hypothetical protein
MLSYTSSTDTFLLSHSDTRMHRKTMRRAHRPRMHRHCRHARQRGAHRSHARTRTATQIMTRSQMLARCTHARAQTTVACMHMTLPRVQMLHTGKTMPRTHAPNTISLAWLASITSSLSHATRRRHATLPALRPTLQVIQV